MTQENDIEQRRRIAEMEKDMTGLDDLHCTFSLCFPDPIHGIERSLLLFLAKYDEALIKLSNAEVQIEDLKLQLDDALGAEEMLVQLTERNLVLGEVKTPAVCFCILANNNISHS
jgi:dynactin 1